MLKALLPLAAALALAPAMPALAQAVCYQDDAGNVVNLGSMCGRSEDRRTPVAPLPSAQPRSQQAAAAAPGVRRNSATNPFPSWLFDHDARSRYETKTSHGDDYSRWVYGNRFVMTLREWPYTATATNEVEWSYVDCQTLWVAGESIRLAGGVGDWMTSPEQAFNPTSHRETYGGLCSRLGL